VFSDPGKRQRLNEITHPRIRQEELARIESFKGQPLIVLNVPLLFENGLEQYVDKVVTVTVRRDVRIQRIMKRDGISAEEIQRILNSQMSDDEKIKRSDFIIDNSGSWAKTYDRVKEIIKELNIQID
jgi:dephospho-CoA kinase